jgi:hypothetical protein
VYPNAIVVRSDVQSESLSGFAVVNAIVVLARLYSFKINTLNLSVHRNPVQATHFLVLALHLGCDD